MKVMEELRKEIKKTQIVIPVGGHGKRLGYQDTPKALIKVAGKTLIEREIELYRDCGFTDYKLLIGYLGDKIKDYLGDGRRLNVKIQYCEDPKVKEKGKGKALKNAIEKGIIEKNRRTIITFPDDIKLNRFLPIMLLAHHIHGYERYGTIATALLISSTTYPYGTAKIDNYGRIEQFIEKPQIHILTNVGVCVMEPQIYDLIKKLIKIDDPKPIEYEKVILPKIAEDRKLYSMIIQGDDKEEWIPVNTRKELERAEKILLRTK